MNKKPATAESHAMADADTANGEQPQPDHADQPEQGKAASTEDPGAPGLSALDGWSDDAVEPNEPG